MSEQLGFELDLPTGYVVVTYAQHAKVCETRSYAIIGGPRAGQPDRGGSGAEIRLCAHAGHGCPLPLSSNAAEPDLSPATLEYLESRWSDLRR